MFEKIVSLLERLVVAVEAIATGNVQPTKDVTDVPAAGPKPARSRTVKEKDTPPPVADDTDFLGSDTPAAPAKKYERADVKAALEKLVKKIGQPAAFELFQKATDGVKALQDVPEDKFAAVMEAAEKALK